MIIISIIIITATIIFIPCLRLWHCVEENDTDILLVLPGYNACFFVQLCDLCQMPYNGCAPSVFILLYSDTSV